MVLHTDEGPSERSAFMKLLQAFMSGYSTGVKLVIHMILWFTWSLFCVCVLLG